jgi:hypothetical protein
MADFTSPPLPSEDSGQYVKPTPVISSGGPRLKRLALKLAWRAGLNMPFDVNHHDGCRREPAMYGVAHFNHHVLCSLSAKRSDPPPSPIPSKSPAKAKGRRRANVPLLTPGMLGHAIQCDRVLIYPHGDVLDPCIASLAPLDRVRLVRTSSLDSLVCPVHSPNAATDPPCTNPVALSAAILHHADLHPLLPGLPARSRAATQRVLRG